jgi:hypothetical protein
MKIKSPIFYGGEIKCILGEISIDALDEILDLMDEYIELREVVKDGNDNRKAETLGRRRKTN